MSDSYSRVKKWRSLHKGDKVLNNPTNSDINEPSCSNQIINSVANENNVRNSIPDFSDLPVYDNNYLHLNVSSDSDNICDSDLEANFNLIESDGDNDPLIHHIQKKLKRLCQGRHLVRKSIVGS